MPELPDVEVFRRRAGNVLHDEVAATRVHEDRILHETSPGALGRQLKGGRLRGTKRRGKHLFLQVGEGWLRLHFGMTGDLSVVRRGGDLPENTAVELELASGRSLAVVSHRLFGEVGWTGDPEQYAEEREIGPDALAGFRRRSFRELFEGRRGRLKSLLTRQESISGLGNVYADEVLYQAGMDPRREAAEVTGDEVDRLYDRLRDVLKRAIAAGADPQRMPEDFLLPHRSPGEACPRCGGEVKKIELSGRPTWLCPSCQS